MSMGKQYDRNTRLAKKRLFHVNALKNICSDKNLRVSENKDILIDQIIEYAGEIKTARIIRRYISYYLL